jgi:hypothetical protein
MSALSRSLTSADPSGRKASPHGTSSPLTIVCGLLRSGRPAALDAAAEGWVVAAEGGAKVASPRGSAASPSEQATRRKAPAVATTRRARAAGVIDPPCHGPANFTRFPDG